MKRKEEVSPIASEGGDVKAVKTENLKRAKELFKSYPSVKELYFTSNGMAFIELNDARNHARSLKDAEIETVKKEN
jgi:uncharacterized pyridoxamine 5'-phosphate oxidase family protein